MIFLDMTFALAFKFLETESNYKELSLKSMEEFEIEGGILL